ncbi:hypothetical protein AMAG_17355 [Allomyces macrogynus ATCC 38327]|uniref:Uncharacterized protein n=1 Tax=Allomyces macrogynus (strain ATCC 38327) TaxID=578462 RepID=A0A0L0TEH2_ALLM3|nr:hypothetical protein AMAG_17355 [Allomyces macrogynus ATCC 38327]|eukprot:KNE73157.1 hypothetical protein AMAG_17355 [Allomyces macrogynus ATCC 38327]
MAHERVPPPAAAAAAAAIDDAHLHALVAQATDHTTAARAQLVSRAKDSVSAMAHTLDDLHAVVDLSVHVLCDMHTQAHAVQANFETEWSVAVNVVALTDAKVVAAVAEYQMAVAADQAARTRTVQVEEAPVLPDRCEVDEAADDKEEEVDDEEHDMEDQVEFNGSDCQEDELFEEVRNEEAHGERDDDARRERH